MTTENPLVTIITVSFNSDKYIKETINSVLNQTYKNIQYVIIDGASTDETLHIIKSFEPLFKGRLEYISEKDSGIYFAMNKGVQLSKGEYITILNSDDFFEEDTIISKVIESIVNNKPELVYSNIKIVDQNNTSIILRNWMSKFGNYKLGWLPPHPGLFVKKSFFELVGPFDERIKIVSDIDWMVRALSNSPSIYYFDEYTVKMRTGGATNKNAFSKLKQILEVKEVYKKNKFKFPLFVAALKTLRKINQLFSKKPKKTRR